MWIFLNNAFLSVVNPAPHDGADPHTFLKVRARFAGDIERVFPDVKVFKTPVADYQFRAFVDRGTVAIVIAQHLAAIDYGNFKSSIAVRDFNRHHAYMRCWWDMHDAQEDLKPKAKRKGRVLA